MALFFAGKKPTLLPPFLPKTLGASQIERGKERAAHPPLACRLEWGAVLCFQWLTAISNRRLSIRNRAILDEKHTARSRELHFAKFAPSCQRASGFRRGSGQHTQTCSQDARRISPVLGCRFRRKERTWPGERSVSRWDSAGNARTAAARRQSKSDPPEYSQALHTRPRRQR